MTAWLAEPFAYGFFGRALAAAVFVGALCGALGVFVVLRRMSYIGHGLAHSVLGGVAVALVFDVNVYAGAAAATVLSALLIDLISRRRGVEADAAIGIVTTAMFALGFAVISLSRTLRVNTESLLFGNVLAVDAIDLTLAAAVGAAFTLALFAFYKPLVFVTFDRDVAAVQGVRAGVVDLLFNLLTAAVIVVSVKVLGVTLVAAAVVIPAALARLLTRAFGRTLALAAAVGVLASVAGLYVSYYVRIPSGAAIVLVDAGLFGVAAAASAAAARARVAVARRRHMRGLDA